jgi:hypothetical protein
MSKATLSFNIPEEKDEFEAAVHGGDYKDVIYQIDMKLRNMEKYEDKEMISIDEARTMIREFLGDLPIF